MLHDWRSTSYTIKKGKKGKEDKTVKKLGTFTVNKFDLENDLGDLNRPHKDLMDELAEG